MQVGPAAAIDLEIVAVPAKVDLVRPVPFIQTAHHGFQKADPVNPLPHPELELVIALLPGTAAQGVQGFILGEWTTLDA